MTYARLILFIFTFAHIAASQALAQIQPNEALIAKYRLQCIPKFIALKRQGHDIGPKVRECIRSRLNDAWVVPKELQLYEFEPWLVNNKGPTESRGLIYFIPGQRLDGPASNRFLLAPHLIKRMNEHGWDVIGAKFPETFRYYASPKVRMLASAAAPYVIQRVNHFKSTGYRRLILAGHSWGGWVALMAAGTAPADALLLLSPSNGYPTFRTGESNPNFKRNITDFGPLLERITIPTLAAFFSDDPEEIPGRATALSAALTKSQTPHYAIENPKGFKGHYAGWLPVFSYAYENCVNQLIERIKPDNCRANTLSNSDFRSIVDITQVQAHPRITSANALTNRKFATYRLRDVDNAFFRYSENTRESTMTTTQTTEVFRFNDGMHCVGSECSLLVKWSENELLEFDPKSGALKAWWSEEK